MLIVVPVLEHIRPNIHIYVTKPGDRLSDTESGDDPEDLEEELDDRKTVDNDINNNAGFT